MTFESTKWVSLKRLLDHAAAERTQVDPGKQREFRQAWGHCHWGRGWGCVFAAFTGDAAADAAAGDGVSTTGIFLLLLWGRRKIFPRLFSAMNFKGESRGGHPHCRTLFPKLDWWYKVNEISDYFLLLLIQDETKPPVWWLMCLLHQYPSTYHRPFSVKYENFILYQIFRTLPKNSYTKWTGARLTCFHDLIRCKFIHRGWPTEFLYKQTSLLKCYKDHLHIYW